MPRILGVDLPADKPTHISLRYLFGIGLSLWALATWVALRERAMILRLAVSTLFVLALFFCHLFAVGVYGLALFAFELQRLLALRARKRAASAREPAPQRQLPAWVDFVASGIPFLPVLPLLLMSPTWTLRWDFTWELGGKLTGLLYVIEVYSRFATFFLATIVAIAALFAAGMMLWAAGALAEGLGIRAVAR